MATLFHGTTLANWNKIQEEGFNGKSQEFVWNCSDDEMYFFDLDKHDDREDICISSAFESAMITASAQNYNGETLIVLKVEVSDEHVSDDYSCPNMDDIASVVDAANLTMESVVQVYECDAYKPSLRLFIASALVGRSYFNESGYSSLEKQAMEAISQEVYIEDMYCFDWIKSNL